MNFYVIITGGNAAFQDNPGELTRIMKDCASKIENGARDGKLLDYNGNTVGYFGFR